MIDMVETNHDVDTEIGILKEQLKKNEAEAEENLNKYKYLLADYDNYRKSIEKESEIIVRREIEKFVMKMIYLRDDYVRAIEIAKSSDNPALVNGLESTLKNLDNILKEEGVNEIEAVGKTLDPNIHEVISFVVNDKYPENIITVEIRKGYMLSDRVIRPSLVEVSKKNDIKSNGE
ncbi:MAG: nucleotide exchange factor GrpE [Thaumarchaeota archaeon]|nr:nucleotide exchange factor GrpE [Nitrososphaerota archaeon]